MPHGARDWANIGADETVHGLDDMAELAARMGSPNTFNREGNVLFIETFEHGIDTWIYDSYGTGHEIRWSALKARYGSYSMRLVPGKDGARLAQCWRLFPYPVLSRFGLEAHIHASGDPEHIDWILYVFDGSLRADYSIRYDFVDQELRLRKASAAWQTFATNVPWSEDLSLFHAAKVVVDFSAETYVRCIFDGTEYNLEAYGRFEGASATSPSIEALFMFTTQSGKDTVVYLDDIIVTQNEP
jgi:hypothetical protein